MNANLTVAIHTILCIAYFEKKEKVTSDFIAASTGMNPVIIRKILGKLQSAKIVSTKAGVGGSKLEKKPEEITLLDIYKAISEDAPKERSVFNFHAEPNPKCPVGSKIHAVLNKPLATAQKAMEKELSKTSIKDLLRKI